MRMFKVGDRLALVTRHQDTRRFAPISTIGVVQAISERHPEKMRVRVYRPDWRPKQGYLHEFLRVSDTIWLERIGIRTEKDGTTNLPHVHEILSELSEKEFEKKHAALMEDAGAS
jgi:hypothetical protein